MLRVKGDVWEWEFLEAETEGINNGLWNKDEESSRVNRWTFWRENQVARGSCKTIVECGDTRGRHSYISRVPFIYGSIYRSIQNKNFAGEMVAVDWARRDSWVKVVLISGLFEQSTRGLRVDFEWITSRRCEQGKRDNNEKCRQFPPDYWSIRISIQIHLEIGEESRG